MYQLVDDVRGEAQAMLRELGARLGSLHREIETTADEGNAVAAMLKDRADAIATAIIGIVARWLRAPAVRGEIVATLRDEFDELRRELLSDIRSTTGK